MTSAAAFVNNWCLLADGQAGMQRAVAAEVRSGAVQHSLGLLQLQHLSTEQVGETATRTGG